MSTAMKRRVVIIRPKLKDRVQLSLVVQDLNGLNIESNESESLNAFSLGAEKLEHIADVLNHATGSKVSKEQVLALAMQLLIENYNADLREMNTAYLRDKVSIFETNFRLFTKNFGQINEYP